MSGIQAAFTGAHCNLTATRDSQLRPQVPDQVDNPWASFGVFGRVQHELLPSSDCLEMDLVSSGRLAVVAAVVAKRPPVVRKQPSRHRPTRWRLPFRGELEAWVELVERARSRQ